MIDSVSLIKIKKVLFKSLMCLGLAAMFAMPGQAALQAVGPISPVNGFPMWYIDANQLALEPCLGDPAGIADAFCVLPIAPPLEPNFNPALPISFPDNFPSEFFYWIAEPEILNVGPNATGRARFRMVLEGAFATLDGSPAAGNQTVFLRINLQPINDLVPGATYTVNHPFGTFDIVADNITGQTPRFRLEDGTALAGDFTTLLPATTTLIGPFLTRAGMPVGGLALNPANPTARYIGDPATPQLITPGPNGAVFSITGPDIGGVGVNTISTDQWLLAGRFADTVPPVIVSTSANPPVIEEITGTSLLNATVTDNIGVREVTADLRAINITGATATLDGAQANTNSTATGSATFVLNTDANTLSFNIEFSGLVAAETAAHIHGPAAPGVDAPVLFPAGSTLPAGSPKVGVWNYPEEQEANITAGLTYVNIHSTLFPAGEIRGQIVPSANTSLMLVSGDNTNGVWQVMVNPQISGVFNFPVNAIDGAGNAATPSSVPLTVTPIKILNLTVDQAAKSTVANISATYTLTVTNIGNAVDNYTLTTANPDGAIVALSATTVPNVAPNNSANVLLNVTGAVDGVFRVNVTATSGVNPAKSATVNTTTTVSPVARGVTLTADAAAKTTTPNVAAVYTLTVTNTGNIADNYTLASDNPQAILGVTTTPDIAPGGSADVTLSVTNATAGAVITANVTATSAADPTVSASVTTTTTILPVTIGGFTLDANGTRGKFINASVSISNGLTTPEVFVIDVSGVAADGFPIVGTATARLNPGETLDLIPLRITVPPTATTGTYALFAGVWRIGDFPDPAKLTSVQGPQNVTVR